MNSVVPILPIDGVSEELVRVLNDRFRQIQTAAPVRGTSTAAATLPAPLATVAHPMIGLCVPGTLGVRSNAAPLVSFVTEVGLTNLTALVKQAPTGASLKANVLVSATVLGMVEIAAGAISGTLTVSATIPAHELVTLDVIQVGSTFPGSDLSVIGSGR